MRKILVVALGLTLFAASAPAGAGAETASAAKKRASKVKLRAFSSCTNLVRYARSNALRTNSVSVSMPRPARPAPVMMDGDGGGGQPPAAAPAPTSGETMSADSGSDFSSTNVQEEGVDEPDVTKTDGQVMFSIAQGRIHAVDVRSTAPKLLGTLKLADGYAQDMLMRGKRLLVFSSGGGLEPMPMPVATPASSPAYGYGGTTVLTEVDITDPAAMKVIRVERIEGRYVSARLNGSTARVVIVSQPQIEIPADEPTPQSAEEYRAQQRRAIRRTRTANWVPNSVLQTPTKTKRRATVACRAVRRAPVFAGLDMLTVLTIDMGKGLPAVDSDALMTSADLVYGSHKNLYVATQRWLPPAIDEADELPKGPITAIHRFDVSDAGRTVYRSSGAIPGFLLSQWSLSEHEGRLRVASTLAPTWWGGEQATQSESFVTVLDDAAGGNLVEVGRVGGLGKGERIYAVRFIGDVGYVVTFRQTDPLYTIDLSKPTAPKVLGELKIMGYSAYLHPIADDLLLGVGQDATEEGRRLGTQLSVFDISDLTNPKRVHQRTLGKYSSSSAEYDHKAFLWWKHTNLLVVPVSVYGEQSQEFNGAIGYRVERAAGISEVGEIEHKAQQGGWRPSISRSLVVGPRLFTLSEMGLMSNALDTLGDGQWLAFPTENQGGG